MKVITKYKSNSGREYNNEKEAIANDLLFLQQNLVSELLPQAVDKSTDFANGGGFIQHTREDVARFKNGIADLIALEFGSHSEALKHFKENPDGIAGRYLDDSGSDTYRLWLRLTNIDELLREWGQGYYKLHPERGTEKPWPETARLGLKYFGER